MSSKWLTGGERQLEEVKRCGQRRIPRTELSILCLQSILSCRPSFRGAGPHENFRHLACAGKAHTSHFAFSYAFSRSRMRSVPGSRCLITMECLLGI